MKISWLKLQNYKSYRDSGEIEFAPDFTVIVGKNNSGKSALLQGLRFRSAGTKPHRSPLVNRDVVLDQVSKFDVEVEFEWDSLENAASRAGLSQIFFPVNQIETDQLQNFSSTWRDFVSRQGIKVALTWPTDQARALALRWPSHGQFADPLPSARLTMHVQFDPQSRQWRLTGIVGNEENLAEISTQGLERQIFVFDAERLNIDASAPQAGQTLNANASNLPTLLHEMQANPHRWEQFKGHVREVFPQITSITTPPAIEGGNQISISVWQVDIETQRDDLAVRLKECGTGVGQVLAILYIAMTRTGNVIAIDEPNSFLHPGASRKLIEILKEYDKNQYVIATHSADLISAIQPSVLHQVTWDKQSGESKVKRVDHTNLDEMSEILSDLGVRLSDIFGADQIVWVEGQTEAKCFPIIAGIAEHAPPSGTMFIPVRATGDFDAKSSDAKQVWDIYKRLTQGVALLPPTIGFSFDREGRTEIQLNELNKESGGLVTFVPRRLLENHFLNCSALAEALSQEFAFRSVEGPPPTPDQIRSSIAQISAQDDFRNNELDWEHDIDWIAICHGAQVIEKLFDEFLLTYSKIRHGEIIARWLVSNDPNHLNELSSYLGSLWHQD